MDEYLPEDLKNLRRASHAGRPRFLGLHHRDCPYLDGARLHRRLSVAMKPPKSSSTAHSATQIARHRREGHMATSTRAAAKAIDDTDPGYEQAALEAFNSSACVKLALQMPNVDHRIAGRDV
jgi:hypothetical protein